MNPLGKIFAILETVVANQERGATYSDILAVLDLPKSTVHRTLKDLTESGYIIFNPESKRYYGSLRIAQLGAEVMANFQLRKHVRPYLEDLHRETELTANLAILDGTVGVFVDKIETRDFGIKLFSELGKTFPLYCTGLGKVFLAFSPVNLLNTLLESPLKQITEKTITDPDALRQEIALIRERGYAVDDEEITRGIICIAAPIFNYSNEIIAAISITFPAYIEQEQRKFEQARNAVTRYAGLISQSLGGMDS